ncbi:MULTISPECIES: helix-hairpin-helix domain-containing protein [Wolbachia]|uniref:helix-hairpin-helix domain-containing protein n=1 Tax=Wolbachia TaxID=953 RepID=UPI0023A97C8C|nr:MULTISPECIES: helix-hairpin-helix domain-containing protein [Wolbachia]MDE5058541.1 helix-hairpin-helix domain-containing protein [Wolbachia endosymbiont of Drosophila baimaii]
MAFQGDVVVVQRAGDVIPKIVEVDKSSRPEDTPKFKFPKVCPECGSSELYKVPEEAAIRCSGVTCKAQIIERLKYFVSNDAFDITGFGDKQIEFFYDLGLIRKISDIFALEEKLKNFNLSELKGRDEKSISNLLDSVNSKRVVSLDKFICSLGIRYVGPHVAKLLAKHYGSYENWYSADEEELMSIIGVGEKIIDSLISFFSEKDNVEMVKNLASQLKIEPVSANVSNSIFSGKTVVFTGKLLTRERNEAQALMESLGGIVSSSVSPKTDFLVVGEKPGSKLGDAKKLGVKILTEEEFNTGRRITPSVFNFSQVALFPLQVSQLSKK